VRSWTPLEGAYQGFLVTHGESISMADHLSLYDQGRLQYRPTVHYAYQPCDDALLSIHELAGKNWHPQSRQRILRDELVDGADELGVLLMGGARGVYWYGSRLSNHAARQLSPFCSATTLQVAAGVLAGVVWALQHPRAGVVEPDDFGPRGRAAHRQPLPGGADRRLWRLDTAVRPTALVSGHAGPRRPLAVQKHPGALRPPVGRAGPGPG